MKFYNNQKINNCQKKISKKLTKKLKKYKTIQKVNFMKKIKIKQLHKILKILNLLPIQKLSFTDFQNLFQKNSKLHFKNFIR